MTPGDIQDLVLSFFRVVGASVYEQDGQYGITLPEKYRVSFRGSELFIAFDRDIASRYDCELVIPGSRVLSLVMEYCTQMGPIKLGQSNNNTGNFVIRYHFFVNFSGMSNTSKLLHVDVAWNTLRPALTVGDYELADFELSSMNGSRFTPAFVAVLDELMKRCNEMRSEFIESAQSALERDYGLLVRKYDLQIRELDQTINKKEDEYGDDTRVARFRFETIERINFLEKERSTIYDLLQEKHKVVLEYGLIGCEVIRT